MTADRRATARQLADERPPSKVQDRWWLFAESPDQPLRDLGRSGKWIVYVAPENHDAVWKKVKAATKKGNLGVSAKAATAKPNGLGGDSQAKAVIVYTADFEDQDDIRRVLRGLRLIGITGRLPYKKDSDTLEGRYGKGTAIYVSQPGSEDYEDRRSQL
jgi:hypothetical protein